MRVINKDHTRLLNDSEPIVIYVFADTHIGNVGFNEALLKEHIKACKNENAYWVHLGDWIEALDPLDKRFDIRLHENPILEQYRTAYDLFEPIKEQGIAMLAGNHDETISKRMGDFVLDLSYRLGVPYLGYSGFVNLRAWHSLAPMEKRKSAEHTFTLFLHHGHGMGNLLGAKGINLQRLSHKFVANIYLIGHVHTYLNHTDTFLTTKYTKKRHAGNVRLAQEYRYYASCPSYINGYVDSVNTYVECKALYPQPTGCLRLEIYQNHEQIKIEPLLGGI